MGKQSCRGGSYNTAALRGGSYNTAALRGGSYNTAALRGGSYNTAALRGGSYNTAALRGGSYNSAALVGGRVYGLPLNSIPAIARMGKLGFSPLISPVRRGVKPYMPSVFAVPPGNPQTPLDTKPVVKAPPLRKAPLKYMLDNGLTLKDL